MKNKFLILIVVGLSGLSHASIEDALDVSQFGRAEENINKHAALQSMALETGMYHGYVSEYKIINKTLEKRTAHFEKLYNFRSLLIEGNLLPPVVIKANNVYESLDADSYRTVSSIYRIRKPASVSYNSINWRHYLLSDWESLDVPFLPKALKPKNNEQSDIWKKYVRIGYERGIEHARDLFSLKLAHLNEDFNGMVLAHRLYQLNMVDFSSLSTLNKGAVVTAKEININDRTVSLNPNDVFKRADQWKPMIKIRSAKQ